MSDDNKPAVALVDLDGSLADFDGAMQEGLDALRAPCESKLDENAYTGAQPHIIARKRLIKSQPGFWSGLRKLRLGFEVYGMLQKLEFERHILTKGPESTTSAWTEKVLWCQMYVSDALITVTQDKSLVYGRVLVDDWPKYALPWLKYRPRGLVIMVAQKWNQEFAPHLNHPLVVSGNIIRYDGSNAQAVYAALSAARNR